MTISPPAPVTETPDVYGAYPRFSEQQVEKLATQGTRRPVRAGDVLFREGDRCGDFFVILSGKVAVVQDVDGDQRVISVHGHHRFLGELNLLSRQVSFISGVILEDGEVLAVPVDRLHALVVEDQIVGDLILRAYLVRRSLLIGHGAGFRIIGSRFSPDTHRLQDFAARNRLPHRFIDVEQDEQAEAILRQLDVTPKELPIVIWRGREVLRNPDLGQLATLIGLIDPVPAGEAVNDLVVIGAGPAGLAAAVYGASEGLRTVVLDAAATGGQAASSDRIENYLGFPSGISGADLAERAVLQAQKFGARISILGEAMALERIDDHYGIRLRDSTVVPSRAVIIATGARYRRLDIPELERFESGNVYYAATKIEVRNCADIEVAVVGGGNSAGQAALVLAKTARTVRLIVRGDNLTESMSRYLVDRIDGNRRVEVMLKTEVRGLIGERALKACVVEDRLTRERRTVPAGALFVFIGAEPNTQWLGDQVALDGHGFVLTGERTPTASREVRADEQRPSLLETSAPGVYAVGDVRSGSVKRLASAVGEGSMAVRLVHQHLERDAEF